MGYVQPTVADFKSQFVRDFMYGVTQDTVMDSDILTAITLSAYNVNPGLFIDQGSFNLGFLYLAAHFLVTNLQNSSQGVAGQYSWQMSSKSAGSVSAGISIPDRILENPEFSMLSKTTYGAQYLFLVLPALTGQIFTICGDTNP